MKSLVDLRSFARKSPALSRRTNRADAIIQKTEAEREAERDSYADVDCLNIDCMDCKYFLHFDICGYAYYITDRDGSNNHLGI